MADASTLNAGAKLVEALRLFFETVGPVWSFVFAVLILGLPAGLHVWNGKRADHAWHLALKSKEDMINQLNEQNRELRLQNMVVGKLFNKSEAAAIIYGEDRLKGTGRKEEP